MWNKNNFLIFRNRFHIQGWRGTWTILTTILINVNKDTIKRLWQKPVLCPKSYSLKTTNWLWIQSQKIYKKIKKSPWKWMNVLHLKSKWIWSMNAEVNKLSSYENSSTVLKNERKDQTAVVYYRTLGIFWKYMLILLQIMQLIYLQNVVRYNMTVWCGPDCRKYIVELITVDEAD